MPRTAITVHSLVPNGVTANLAEVASDDTNEHEFTNPNGRVIIIVDNRDGAIGVEFTFISVAEPRYGRTGNVVETVAAGEMKVFGPFDTEAWNQSDNLVDIDVDTTEPDCHIHALAI